ncbi:MAG: AMP-binding protein [Actinomycetota bacterium]|nr:AMP-binding protein [Actinomycetota bacterium]
MGEHEGFAAGDTMWALFADRVRRTPDAFMFGDEHGRRFTCAQMQAWAERVAAGFHSMGVDGNTVVSWQLPTRIETVIVSMALSRLGAVQNPIIHLYREREVGALLRIVKAQLFLVPGVWKGFDYGEMAAQLQAAAPTNDGPTFDILLTDDGLPEGDPTTLPPAPTDPHAVKWLYSTSGTTSEPKAVRHSDGGLIAAGTGIAKMLQPGLDDIAALAYPYAHIGGPDHLVMALRTGMATVTVEQFTPAGSFPLFADFGVTVFGGGTAHYLAYINTVGDDPQHPPLPALRQFTGGGAPKPPELFWRMLQQTGVRIRHGYGMTECPMIANGSVHDTDEQLANTDGAPVHGCEVIIVDEHEQPVAAGVDGDICVRGPMLFKGYLNEGADAEAFRPDGFFRTGDRGHLRADGHIVLTGRTKELIIRKGENISPREVEDVLMSHPSVGAIAVIGLPDEARGERACAVIETAPGATPITFQQMAEHCRAAGLMTQKIPEQLEVVDVLPRNPTLKILKRVLVEQFK